MGVDTDAAILLYRYTHGRLSLDSGATPATPRPSGLVIRQRPSPGLPCDGKTVSHFAPENSAHRAGSAST